MRWLVCLLTGHRWIRTITDIHLDEVSFADIRGTITGQRTDCARCHRTRRSWRPGS